jgi:hypothetical protein
VADPAANPVYGAGIVDDTDFIGHAGTGRRSAGGYRGYD